VNRALHLRGVEIRLDGRALIPPLDVSVAPGETLTIMGPSGSGKSTLLAYISGFLHAPFRATGTIHLGDTDVTALPPERRRMGILFQDALLFPHLSVRGNLLFGLARRGEGRKARERRVDEALERAGLGGFGPRDPATLSGGQRARVAVLRTLLAEPRALLLDEPFSKLDAALRAEFRAFVFSHARDGGLPTILVTHDAEDAAAAGGEVIQL